jgi:hypothetical protein
MARHHDPAAEMPVIRIKRRKCAALISRQQSLQHGAALRIELASRLRPVDRIDAPGSCGRCAMDDVFRG